MNNDKRVRINKRMVAWSDGREIHLPPSVRREVDGPIGQEEDRRSPIEKGYEADYLGAREYYEAIGYAEFADRELEYGNELAALRYLLLAAGTILEFDDDYRECLHPLLNPPSQRNIQTFVQLIERCKALCQVHPRYWPIVKASDAWSDYLYIRQVYGEYGYDL